MSTTVRTERDRRRPVWSYWREYVSVAPFFVLFLAFGIVPLGFAVFLSMQSWDGLGPFEFVGLAQFEELFGDSQFWTAVTNTVVIFLLGQIPVVLGALVAASILSRPGLRGKGFYSTLLFLPQVTSLVAVAVVFQSLFSNEFGIINNFLQMLGVDKLPWMTDTLLVKVVIAAMVVWRGLGFFLVVFLAGMAAIPTDVYDAARIDGAGPVRTFWSITLPLLRPSIIFVSLTGTIAGLQMYTEPRVLFDGTSGPNDAALTMMLMQVQYMGGAAGGRIPDLGYATVIGWAVFVILVFVAVFNTRLLRLAERD